MGILVIFQILFVIRTFLLQENLENAITSGAYAAYLYSVFPVAAKLCLFAGFALGTFAAGVVSDWFGRRLAITIFSQLLFAAGFLATVMPNVTAFAAVWFVVGEKICAIASSAVSLPNMFESWKNRVVCAVL